MSILVLAADGTGSREPIELGEVAPHGWAAWRPPSGDEIVFRGSPTVDDLKTVALYAVAPDGGTLRTLSEPIGPPEFDPAIDRPAISPDGRTVTYWSWGPNDAGEVNGWGRVFDLEAGTERTSMKWGGSVEPGQPGRSLGGWRRRRSIVRVR